MNLREQYERELAVLGGRHPAGDLTAFARFVNRAPWVFGPGLRTDAKTSARELLRELVDAPPSRWEPTSATTPSGKTILRCRACGTETPLPGPCRRLCEDDYDLPPFDLVDVRRAAARK